MSKQTVLIVDDETNISELIKLQLEAKGYCAITAADGADAMAKCRAIAPDLVILDINMPNMNGLEFLQNMLTPQKKTPFPVMVLTRRKEFEESFKDIEVAGFMAKPFLVEELIREVERVLG